MAHNGETPRAGSRSASRADRLLQDRRMHGAKSETPPKDRRTLFKGWRPTAFLVATLLAIGLGLHFKTLSDPGQESKQFANEVLPSFNVFVSSPNISVHISADLQCGALISTTSCVTSSSDFLVALDVTVSPPSLSHGTILITSNLSSYSKRISALPFSTELPLGAPDSPARNARIYEDEFPAGSGSSELDFEIPDVLEEAHGSVFGRLPVIGDLDGQYTAVPAILTESAPDGRGLADLIYNPLPKNIAIPDAGDDPNAYQTLHGGHVTLFWTPKVLSITEDLQDIAGILSTQQLDYMTPPAEFQGQDYSWDTDNELQPNFKSTDPQAIDSQNSNAFISGIFLGIAGAAAIALLQELPKDIPLPSSSARRKRVARSSPENT
jgi:hypothetical protein